MPDYKFITFRMDTQSGDNMYPFNRFAKFCLQRGLDFHYDNMAKEFQIVYFKNDIDIENAIIRHAKREKLQKITHVPTTSSIFTI